MTIDERLEKLAERHEALAQSVEHLALENATNATLVREISVGIKNLLAIAQSHEKRISRLEE